MRLVSEATEAVFREVFKARPDERTDSEYEAAVSRSSIPIKSVISYILLVLASILEKALVEIL